MAYTKEQLEADRDALRASILKGHTEVRMADGRSLRTDLAVLMAMLGQVEAQLAALSAVSVIGGWPTHRRLARVSTGLASGGGDDAPEAWNRLYRWP